MTEHADFEALSAYVDGEGPEWAAHVAACATCRASAEELRAVAAAVAAPVEPPAGAVREAAITNALDGEGAGERAPARPSRRASQARWMFGAAAALVIVVVGVAALLAGSGGSSSRQNTVAAPALQSTPPDGAADSAAPLAPVADLGDVPDAATLLSRSGISVGAKSSGGAGGAAAAPSPANSGAAAITPAAGNPGSVSPTGVGAPPCEAQARARQPSLGPVVYFATARHGNVPAVVLGFSNGSGSPPLTLLLLAQDGCAELLRAVGP